MDNTIATILLSLLTLLVFSPLAFLAHGLVIMYKQHRTSKALFFGSALSPFIFASLFYETLGNAFCFILGLFGITAHVADSRFFFILILLASGFLIYKSVKCLDNMKSRSYITFAKIFLRRIEDDPSFKQNFYSLSSEDFCKRIKTIIDSTSPSSLPKDIEKTSIIEIYKFSVSSLWSSNFKFYDSFTPEGFSMLFIAKYCLKEMLSRGYISSETFHAEIEYLNSL